MKKVIIILIGLIVAVASFVVYKSYNDTKDPYVQKCDFTVPESEIPTFKDVDINFVNKFNDATDLPFMGSALIDVDNDGVDELFVGGGHNQRDGIFKFVDGKFENISDEVNLPKGEKTGTIGAVSFDLDENGSTDLILARRDGVFFLKNIEGKFESQKLDITVTEKSNPISLTFGDYDKDGDADMFLCTYLKPEAMEGQNIFNKHGYGSNSIMLRNDGDLVFTDVTEELNLTYTHNTFQAIMVDIDDDGWLDIVVAYDTGRPRVYKNNGGKDFSVMDTPLTGKFSYPMGIALGDYDNNGKVDFFFSNTGSTVPGFLAKGDLTEDQEFISDWILFKNEGDFKFTDAAKATKIADFEFSWGAIFEDFNLDGRQDLSVAENYIAFPGNKLFKLPCRFLIQRDDQTFAAVEQQAGVINMNYAITPLSSDFNQDGYPDLIYVNLDGPVRVLLNGGGKQNYLKIRFPETGKFAGAKAEVKTANGKRMSDFYVIGEGLCSDLSNVLTYGIDPEDTISEVIITYTDGTIEKLIDVELNQTIIAGSTLSSDEPEVEETLEEDAI